MIIALLGLGVLAVFFLFFRPDGSPAKDSLEKRLARDREIVGMLRRPPASALRAGTATWSLPERLALRAAANARLRLTFGIDNSLTTADKVVHRAFHNTAMAIIHEPRAATAQNNQRGDVPGSGPWMVLYALADEILAQEVNVARRGSRPILLANAVRCLCLRVVLAQVFQGRDPRDLSQATVLQVTQLINQEWIESKSRGAADASVVRGRASPELASALHMLVMEMTEPLGPAHSPDQTIEECPSGDCKLCKEKRRLGDAVESMSPEEILGLLMPPYETLWRVVLLTFVTACYHQPREDTAERLAGVPDCLGRGSASENRALTVADVSLSLVWTWPSLGRLLVMSRPCVAHTTRHLAGRPSSVPIQQAHISRRRPGRGRLTSGGARVG